MNADARQSNLDHPARDSAGLRYFAYGSNLRRAQMARLCPDHEFLGPARLAGYRLVCAWPDEEWQGGVADVQPDPESEVWGALYRISAADLARLDAYEVYDPAGPESANDYLRRAIRVETADGRSVDRVECYFVRAPQGHVPPSPAYRRALLEGATECGLPRSYVEKMRAILEAGPAVA